MAVYKRGGVWWYSFIFAGKRIQESTHTHLKTLAREAEANRKRQLQETLAGVQSEDRFKRIRTVSDAVNEYLEGYAADHAHTSTVNAKGRLKVVVRHMGTVLLPDLIEARIRKYMTARKAEGASNRTVNMELGELSRAIGRTWRELWPKVNKMTERTDVGRALSADEERRLLDATSTAVYFGRSPLIGTLIRMALATGMRAAELTSLQWGQVDLFDGLMTVGKAKTEAGTGRVIPMNTDVRTLLAAHRDWWVSRFGQPRPEHYVFPWGSPVPKDPMRPTVEIKSAWDTIRKAAGVDCRWHDLRHTVATKMAEAGVPESTMLAIMGHMSRKMLERYSHIRMAAKREAVEALALRSGPKPETVSTVSTTVDRMPKLQ
jgi:integrase